MINLLENVSLDFDEVKVLKDFTLEVQNKKITCLVGPSGCGKSSVLNLIAGLLPIKEGQLNVQNERIGYIFQEDRLLPWETVYQNVKLVRDTEDKDEIMNILTALELDEFKDKYPSQLSGGMKQRCAIARGFYYHSTLLLMDEPFKSLDYDLRLNLVDYLSRLWKMKQNTIVFVTHDIDEALLLGHRIVVLSKRPSSILDVYDIDTDHAKRQITNEDHMAIRNKIIKQMSQERG